jgi:hypothetical protein
VLVLLGEAGLGAAVVEEDAVEGHHYEQGLLDVLKGEPLGLFLVLTAGHNHVVLEEVELVEEQAV